jgi:predicted ArsR family transcriptional regulator
MSAEQEGSTRTTLLTLLRTRGTLSVNEMAKELGITEMAVRRHVHTFEGEGMLDSRLSRQAMGRPTRRYFLTLKADELFPKNYPVLALDLLDELDGEAAGMVDILFERRKRKLISKYEDRMKGKALSDRVAELAEIQNAGGYMVNWRPDDEGFVFEEFNCPIAQVAQRYNQACTCELALFEKLLDADVQRTECLTKGGFKCKYVIREAKA